MFYFVFNFHLFDRQHDNYFVICSVRCDNNLGEFLSHCHRHFIISLRLQGLTETCAGLTIQAPSDLRVGELSIALLLTYLCY